MEPEPELYWQCDCGHTNVTAPSAFKRTGSAAHVCSECERPTQLTRANCTTERRVPVGTQLPPDGIIGGEPGVEYVFAPTHDSGATVVDYQQAKARLKESDTLRARIAALEAVIAAQSEHAKAIARSNWTAFELAEALHAAGLDAEPVRGGSI